MGLLSFFRGETKVAEKPTAVEYVEWLLKHMLKTSRLELTVNTRKALPGSSMQPSDDDAPPCVPEAMAVINRLKILSGVNPVRQPKTVAGRFERPRTHHTIEVLTSFLDSEQESACMLRLRIHGRNSTCDLDPV